MASTTHPSNTTNSSTSTVGGQSTSNNAGSLKNAFIRGVNIGGWLLLEPFITPYMFALTDCHTKGNICFFPNQISAPKVGSSDYDLCDMYQCKFLLDENEEFIAKDEYTLASQFQHKSAARTYLTYHWENFVTKKDVDLLKEAKVTHVRVPMPHWIMGDILDDEPWVNGQWVYFVQFVGWCRDAGIQVWPDIHTAPGSQNGFDNSGRLLPDKPTCLHWSSSPTNVRRSLQAVQDISQAIVNDNLQDVVTGFGVLNEPFMNCDPQVVQDFYLEALKVVRTTIGPNTAVYIGDLFNATKWNNGWWTDEEQFSNTYLDSHYYHCFDGNDRKLSPKQHIALVCKKDTRATQSCCYSDAPKNTIPSKGISRLVGEWSAAYDSEPGFRLKDIMGEIIKKQGDTPNFNLPNNNATQNKDRQKFLKQFVQAQMVAYESAATATTTTSNTTTTTPPVGISKGWFFWTLKMEFGSLGEWDFSRGYREGWIPTLPPPNETSESHFGTCLDIANSTIDDMTIVDVYPDPSTHPTLWNGPPVDDDFVLSHAGSRTSTTTKTSAPVPAPTTTTKKQGGTSSNSKSSTTTTTAAPTGPHKTPNVPSTTSTKDHRTSWFAIWCVALMAYGIWKVFLGGGYRNNVPSRRQYTNIDDPIQLSV